MRTLELKLRPKFRDKLATYLLESDAPVPITRHGDTVGYYIPARRRRSETDRAALKEATSRWQQILATEGISEVGAKAIRGLEQCDQQGRPDRANRRNLTYQLRRVVRGGFHRAYPRAKQQAFLEVHELGFAYFEGVFRVLRYDNLSSAVKKILRGQQRELTARFLSSAEKQVKSALPGGANLNRQSGPN
jgi:hypothetical protein